MNHTPGPWSLFVHAGTIQVDGPGERGSNKHAVVHWVGFDSGDRPRTEKIANARLISAAPELLEALKAALLCIDDEVNIYAPEMCDAKRVKEARARHAEGGTLHYYATVISKARAAIDKAKADENESA